MLDAFFGNVCELDLVFNFYKVCACLEILGGEREGGVNGKLGLCDFR